MEEVGERRRQEGGKPGNREETRAPGGTSGVAGDVRDPPEPLLALKSYDQGSPVLSPRLGPTLIYKSYSTRSGPHPGTPPQLPPTATQGIHPLARNKVAHRFGRVNQTQGSRPRPYPPFH